MADLIERTSFREMKGQEPLLERDESSHRDIRISCGRVTGNLERSTWPNNRVFVNMNEVGSAVTVTPEAASMARARLRLRR